MVLGGYGLRRFLVEKWLSGDLKPVMLVSRGVGVGKSSIVYESARDYAEVLGLDFYVVNDEEVVDVKGGGVCLVDFDLLTVEAYDLRGIPVPDGDVFRYVFHNVRRLLENKDLHIILFFDDVSWVRNVSVRVALNRVVLKRVLAGVRLHERTFIVGACNLNVRLEEPVRDRFEWVEVGEPSVEDWLRFMDEFYGDGWFKEVGMFLSVYPDALMYKGSRELVFDSPRGWSDLAVRLYKLERYKGRLDELEILNIARGYVSSESASKFVAWLKVRSEVGDDVDVYFEDVSRYMGLRTELRVFVLEQYLSKNKNNLIRLRDVLVRLYDVSREEFVLAWSLLDGRVKRELIKLLPKNIVRECIEVVRLVRDVGV